MVRGIYNFLFGSPKNNARDDLPKYTENDPCNTFNITQLNSGKCLSKLWVANPLRHIRIKYWYICNKWGEKRYKNNILTSY